MISEVVLLQLVTTDTPTLEICQVQTQPSCPRNIFPEIRRDIRQELCMA